MYIYVSFTVLEEFARSRVGRCASILGEAACSGREGANASAHTEGDAEEQTDMTWHGDG